ncbi:uncharacterized protein L203_100974 [Cryptococcus depauperatus CBS 7841]|uniref:Metallo-beta-lactamase domain-containing protein n=1 Tax=Cryptococcus depauperatus CBS 7841 TaxID=1295531 RepID=A0AAJ8JNY5_9TREE
MTTQQPLQVLFMGTGTSTALPITPCLTLTAPYPESWNDMVPIFQGCPPSSSAPTAALSSPSQPLIYESTYDPDGIWPKNIPCTCCRSCVDTDVPEGWKNKRGNTSIVVRKQNQEGKWKNIVVDVGKTFREQAMRLFPRWNVQTIDAVLLTHGHADAYLGLDDLREWCIRQGRAIPVYLNRETFVKVEEAFPYMVDKSKASGGGDIPQLVWNIIDDEGEFQVQGINVKAFPVHHGIYFHSVLPLNGGPAHNSCVQNEPLPLICLAFEFDESVIYMSDETNHFVHARSSCSRECAPKPTNPGYRQPLSPNQSFSASFRNEGHPSHFSFAQALTTSLRLKAANTYLIGMVHPTSHFMWEEICQSLLDPDGRDHKARNHPDARQAEWLVKRIWDGIFTEGRNGQGLGDRWRTDGGVVKPAWDGLVLEVNQKDEAVERLDKSTKGLFI